ncbi:MAG: dihydrofolate reductase [Proteobacteria bacterium]|nr:dihydrofolate reductase [Pseudomonadota bacterium]
MKPKITIIVAVAKNGIIGANGKIPWHCKGELPRFKRTTMSGDRICIFGHNTYATLPIRPLPGRTNAVISQSFPPGAQPDGSIVFDTLDGAVAHFRDASEVFICGGAYLYKTALPIADKLIYTIIDAEPDGDTKFPDIDWNEWNQTLSEPGEGFTVTEWKRK